MSDERLRKLERAFIESNSPEDELAWIQERVRQGESLDWESYSRLVELNVEAASEYLLARVERGELEQEKLELAAYCSHEPARVALGEDALEVPEDLEEWAHDLAKWGPSVEVRTALTSAWRELPFWETEHAGANAPRLALEAVERWILDQSYEALMLALEAAIRSLLAGQRCTPGGDHSPIGANAAATAALLACKPKLSLEFLAALVEQESLPSWVRRAIRDCSLSKMLAVGAELCALRSARTKEPSKDSVLGIVSGACRRALAGTSEEARHGATREILPWCLLGDDPVQRRVASRLEPS